MKGMTVQYLPEVLNHGGSREKQQQQQAQSSEEEHGFGDDGTAAASVKRVAKPQSPCPWQRIKWADSMVRLLVWIVHSVGEDAAGGDCGEQQPKLKKAAALEAASGTQQKKGKWKSVSRVMMEKGFYVSPQQCEDKFNDLNKRYKRLIELVGKGTASMLVDNPTLLDSLIDHLPNKAVKEVRKLISSKHLFFREMCAYHNTCPVPTSTASSSDIPRDLSPSVMNGQKGRDGIGTLKEENPHFDAVDEASEEEEYSGDGDEEYDNDKEMIACGGIRRREKRAAMWPAASSPLSLSLSSTSGCSSDPMQQLKSETIRLSGEQQQGQWLRMRTAELEEQRVAYQHRALRLERQRFKWLRFSGNKEREMKRARLINERRRLENERMLLLVQQKEFDLLASASNANVNKCR